MVGNLNSAVCDPVDSLKVLSWGQRTKNKIEVEFTLASLFSNIVEVHIEQRTTDESGSADKVTGGMTATYLTMSSDRDRA